MKKFIVIAIGVISLILVLIAFLLAQNSSGNIFTNYPAGNWYELVWTRHGVNVLACIGFFLLCVGSFFGIVAAIPFKFSKFLMVLVGLMFVGAGVLMLLTPGAVYSHGEPFDMAASYTAVCVLTLVAGGVELVGACVGFLPEKK